MQEEEFLALIKLVSGEEIISMTSELEEDDIKLLILNHPLTISEIKTNRRQGLKFNHWMKFSDDYLHIINFDKIITLSKVKNSEIKILYHRFISKYGQSNILHSDNNRLTLTEEHGLIGNVDETRKKLENLFKSKSISSEP